VVAYNKCRPTWHAVASCTEAHQEERTTNKASLGRASHRRMSDLEVVAALEAPPAPPPAFACHDSFAPGAPAAREEGGLMHACPQGGGE
jgi:hypothetical protein